MIVVKCKNQDQLHIRMMLLLTSKVRSWLTYNRILLLPKSITSEWY
jgi:hypothetical protein